MARILYESSTYAVIEEGGRTLTIIPTRCIDCENCVSECPNESISIIEAYVGDGEWEQLDSINMKFNLAACDVSGDCVNVCPTEALLLGTVPQGGGGGGGGGEGGGDDDDYVPFREITNELTIPCLSNVFQEVNSSGNFTTKVGQILHDTFAISETANLEISESFSLPSTTDGTTNILYSGEYFTAIIKLNGNTLPSSSQEYIAATILHEVLHAYLGQAGKTTELNDHNVMANKYLNDMTNTLKFFYPSLPTSEAEALAWGGLQNTNAWKSLETADPTKAADIRNINVNHHNGHTGSVCE